MKIPRLFTGEDGETHWGEIELMMSKDSRPAGYLDTRESAFSQMVDMTSAQFVVVAANSSSDWHNSPRRQYVVILAGEVNYEASDGTIGHFDPGGIFLTEDRTGKGHRSYTGPEERRMIIAGLAE